VQAWQRQRLLGDAAGQAQQRQILSEQQLAREAEDVTESLRRSRQLMAQNVEQTAGTLDILGGWLAGARAAAPCAGRGPLPGSCAACQSCRWGRAAVAALQQVLGGQAAGLGWAAGGGPAVPAAAASPPQQAAWS
jgi:hypothetical protein